jgi:phosphosulfolactate phosphohydrolase-like enzyme
MKKLEAHFTPADFNALRSRNLDDAVCVVFDIFRATSSMITALANGAAAIIPVGEISEALAIRAKNPDALLAGERDGLRIRAELTGGTDFDLGNSPREFTREKIAGKTIAITTTNGTRALRACAHAKTVLAGSFLNLRATADFVRQLAPENLILICSGTFEESALEDVLGAGALADLLWNDFSCGAISDSALMARQIFQLAQNNLLEFAGQSRNGKRLLSRAELKDDVAFCLQRDVFDFVAVMRDGKIQKSEVGSQKSEKFARAIRRFDEENSRDPNVQMVNGVTRPRELVYAEWLTDWILKLCPNASEPLRLAARCQHICRWMSPRESYPMTREGYLKWRAELKKFHAQKSGEILREVGYPEDVIERVQALNLKKDFPRDPESRVLEDALCLVFLEHQFAELASKTDDDKMIVALQKSWKKMTPAARTEALKLSYGPHETALLERALKSE